MSSQQGEKNPQNVVVELGSPSADAVITAMKAHRKMKLLAAYLINNAAVTQSDTDYVVINVKDKSGNVMATVSTKLTGGDAAIVKDVPLALTVNSTYSTIENDDYVQVQYDETDAGSNVALTSARVQLVFANIGTCE